VSAVYRPGTWCDVCVLPDGRIAFVRVQGNSVVCEIDGVEAWRVDVGVASLFLRCEALADGTVAAIVKANDPQGSALLILRGVVKNLGATAGNNPVAITATHAYIVNGPATAHRVRFDDGFSEPVPLLWTSQGIRDVRPDGTGSYIVISADGTYASVVRGYNFGEYQTRGDLTVGQHGYGIGVLTKVLNAQGKPVDYFFGARFGSVNYGVHGAQSGSRIAVCAYTEGGSYYQDFTPPYPASPNSGTTAPNPGTPVPQPAPTPKPEPKPVATPNRLDIVIAVAGQHPELVKLNTKDACGLLTEYIAAALHAADPGWGLLSKSAGENNYQGHAVDAVIYRPTQQVIDLMSGAGDRDLLTPQSTAQQRKDFDHDIRVKWSEVGKRADNNWVPPIQGSTPVPPPAPPPVGDDLAALRNEVAALSVKLALAEARITDVDERRAGMFVDAFARLKALEQKPAAHSGDAVEVTGSVSLSDAYGRKKLTWTGKIL
jgi:hypothetical protein